MATGNYVLDKGYNAAAAITKFYAVKYAATPETVTPVTAIGDMIAGFAQFGVATSEITRGKGCVVRKDGITEAVAGAAIPLGSLVELLADGRVRVATAASAARIVGKCVGHAAVNAGDRISLEITTTGGLVGATF